MKRGVKRLFRFPRRSRDAVREEVHEEFEFHLEMRTEELVRAGLTTPAARAQALTEFGDPASGAKGCIRHEVRIERRRWLAQTVSEFRQDMLLGIRLIARNPWYSTAAILTLAVAISGNTTIFSVANALVFKPLPVVASHELALVRAGESQMSWLNYQDLVERNRVFSAMVAHRRIVAGLATGAAPARLWGEQTSANYFSVLGVPAALGRTYMPFDTRRDLVVLADHTWRARFGADPSVVGRALMLNGRSYEVVGVMPRRFRGAAPAGLLQDFWMPVDGSTPSAMLRDRGATRFEIFGRLMPGVSHTQATPALRAIGQQMRADHPDIAEAFVQMEVFPLDGIGGFRGMGDLILPVLAFLTLMAVIAALVLLIGCANIGGLLIGRAAARRKEIAVRLALGAGRGRLVRQLLTESLVLAILGGGAGVVLAVWITTGVNPLLSRLPVPMEFDLRLDRRVLLYALTVSVLATFVFGLAPARRASRFDLVSSLKDDAGGSAVRQRLRRALVVGQVAVCSVLLIWSGLFLRSLSHIGRIDPGFDPEGVVLARIELDDMTHGRAFGEQLFADLEQQVEASPTVQSAGAATVVPLSLENEEFDVERDSEGHEGGSRMRQRVFANRLTAGWFDAVRIPLLAGRDFTADDREGSPEVAIVNETLARQFWDGSAVGKRLRVPEPSHDRILQVVGVVRDSKYWTLGEKTAPTIYRPLRQAYAQSMTLHVRTRDPRKTTELIAREMQRRAPDVFVDISPMADTMSVAVLPARVGAALTAAFGVVAMLLAALGVYGLVAFSVVQRTREIGLRKAIGARTSDLIRLIVGENIVLAMSGFAAGVVLGVLGANVLRTFIAGVSPTDPVTLGATGLLVCGTTLVASALPAMRAALVNPLVALRDP
jgi:putative ABC transport system permease protein